MRYDNFSGWDAILYLHLPHDAALKVEMIMPKKVARILAADDAVGTEELEAVIHYLNDKLHLAEINCEPVPFLTYRNRRIFETTLRIRTGQFANV